MEEFAELFSKLNLEQQRQITNHFAGFITENKRELMDKVLANRTKHITVVVEDIKKYHNANAVVRSCECFGIQDVHVIEQGGLFDVRRGIAKGSYKWINVHRYNDREEQNTQACLTRLKQKGYQLLVTSPEAGANLISDVDINKPIALMFGTEKDGISELAKEQADGLVKVPMYGFTESLNISVSVAICLHNLISRLHDSAIDWHLAENEELAIKLDWYWKVINKPEIHFAYMLKQLNQLEN
jgi:tRNA (guanosine-2'-O-)-methyltransferase